MGSIARIIPAGGCQNAPRGRAADARSARSAGPPRPPSSAAVRARSPAGRSSEKRWDSARASAL